MNLAPETKLVVEIFASVVIPIFVGGWTLYNRLVARIDRYRNELKDDARQMEERLEKRRQEDQQHYREDQQRWKWLFDWAHQEIGEIKEKTK